MLIILIGIPRKISFVQEDTATPAESQEVDLGVFVKVKADGQRKVVEKSWELVDIEPLARRSPIPESSPTSIGYIVKVTFLYM
jgi:hypothetical protein